MKNIVFVFFFHFISKFNLTQLVINALKNEQKKKKISFIDLYVIVTYFKLKNQRL